MSRFAAGLLAAAVALAAAPAAADVNDVHLWKLGSPRENLGDGTPNAAYSPHAQARFEALATQLGLALTSVTGGPARTTGASGFAIDLQWSNVSLPGDRTEGDGPVWPVDEEGPTSLAMPSIHVRKGLPYSFEIGMRLSQIEQSEMLAATLEIRAAVVEGIASAPDVSVRVHAGRLLGARDLGLVAGGFDFTVSKEFPLFRTLRLAPYAGYDPTLIFANSNAIDFDPGSETFDNPALDDAVFETFSSMFHRFYAGARLGWGPVNFALEYSHAAADQDSVGAFSAVTGLSF
jgi:hypothetical protein